MTCNERAPHGRRVRRSIRRKDHDYSQGGTYFVTICTQDRASLFGGVVDGILCRGEAGSMVRSTWLAMPNHYPGVQLDEFVVMPDHVHGIVVLDPAPRQARGLPPMSLGDVVRGFKTLTTHRYALGVRDRGWPRFRRRLWHRNYYERILYNDASVRRVRAYILRNPEKWVVDARAHPRRDAPRG